MSNELTDQVFLSWFTHDLRQHLRGITIQAERCLLRDGENPNTSAALGEILSSAHRQEELISAVIEYHGAAELFSSSGDLISLQSTIMIACETVDGHRQTCGGFIHFEAARLPPVKVPFRVARVLEHILDNALKFTGVGTIPEATIAAALADNGDLIINIVDSGIGIEPAYRERIFQPFQRLNPASQYSGCGMGLAIASRLAQSMGGTISVGGTSHGSGAIFTILLPAAS